jgi:hypothetical protein
MDMWGNKLGFSLLSARPCRMVSQEHLAIDVVAWRLSLPDLPFVAGWHCLAVLRRSILIFLPFALKRVRFVPESLGTDHDGAFCPSWWIYVIWKCDSPTNNGLSNVQLDKIESPKASASRMHNRQDGIACSRLITQRTREDSRRSRGGRKSSSKLLCVRPQKPRFRPYLCPSYLAPRAPVEENIAIISPSLLFSGRMVKDLHGVAALITLIVFQSCPSRRMNLGARQHPVIST